MARIRSLQSRHDAFWQRFNKTNLTFLVKPCPLLDDDNKIDFGPSPLPTYFKNNFVGTCRSLIKSEDRSPLDSLLTHSAPHDPLLLTSSSPVLSSAGRKYFFSCLIGDHALHGRAHVSSHYFLLGNLLDHH